VAGGNDDHNGRPSDRAATNSHYRFHGAQPPTQIIAGDADY
jgi:hypothetical protein